MKDGRILTMLDLKDIAELGRARRIRKFMLTAFVILVLFCVAFAAALARLDVANADLKKATALAQLERERADVLQLRLDKYDSMMKVVIDGNRLSKPVRISGELIVMVAGKVVE